MRPRLVLLLWAASSRAAMRHEDATGYCRLIDGLTDRWHDADEACLMSLWCVLGVAPPALSRRWVAMLAGSRRRAGWAG